ncbi:Pleiotropic ABC efflux transporter of multiple drugs [Nakaseomyces glabratus]|uniref:Pleiotropic ABC efflux transporter of multiple drugs n=1 Tax=Candida glabrata TaxID=5478 RepID=A0A0W0D3F5_CANGB|nr:ABC transporter [Nakaseomyces glabratus]KAJ9573383.1 Multidrug resistance protein [Nakaseomyces glabratus]KTB04421.1 Pleiotropic ABC efflux transporter of multiple drugs [Nakaseomyces glabratus]KTB06372.1 Pleiotropic ABC efflux transporter of multiple drugs [Nakaseomyces glabratus]KTB08141.1 Pleiotropic ABC efflux transporter of multiple drugs [Nakaseomyces glabratus]
MSLASDKKDADVASTTTTAQDDDNLSTYHGFDHHVQDQVRQLARTLTQQSSLHQKKEYTLPEEGINPIFTNTEADDYNPRLDPTSDEFSSAEWVQNMSNISNSDPDYYKPYSLGCYWKDLVATGESADIEYQANFLNGPYKGLKTVYNTVVPSTASSKDKNFKILKSMEGAVNPGELLVVLGRPGSGCTTLLKSISSNTHGFNIAKESTISYSGMTPNDIRKHFRGEVVYNAEADIHLPHLTVYQTLLTVARLKTPQNRLKGIDRETYARHLTEVAMATFGLSHTRNTKVGNDLVRGVSGGERKRVSIAEVSICGSKFQCWDNATRGLDSATALEFIRALKVQASISNAAATVAIYQCSQDAYDLFDKVCVLYDGYQIYFGPAGKAKEYFQKMGYVSPERQTTADFLTAVTSPSERIINQDYINRGIFVPQTPKEMWEYWRASEDHADLIKEIDSKLSDNYDANLAEIKDAHVARQSKRARPSSPYTVSYGMQIKYLLIRNFWRIKQSSGVTLFMVIGNSSMAFILGSMFYKVMKHNTTSTFYFRGAAMFFAVLFNAFSSLLEIFSLFEARPITEKHRTYSLYHPSADAFASILSEVPAKLITAVCFNIIYYFLVNFRRNGGVFFFYFLINIVAVFAMSHLFRCVGSVSKTLSAAMVPASMLLLGLSMYSGFAIPRTKILGWSKWIWYINPLAYLFESLMINEFHDRKFPCSQYIPSGSVYNNVPADSRICSSVGAIRGNDYVLGDDFLRESYSYLHKHKWRGFGIGLAYVIFFLVLYLILCEYNEGAKQKGEILVFPQNIVRRMKKERKLKNVSSDNDVEIGDVSDISDKKILADSSDESEESGANIGLSQSEAIFHWRNLCYDVQIKKETRRILNNVDGWVKPGTLTALMGASGAGKTTLLDCLAERVTMGVITGEVSVDGKQRDDSFARSIGYCQQQDLHLKTSTVRESLRFSAYLRQPADVSIEEKNQYVEDVIKILEMEQYADAVVGVPGEGLNVEQRKRLTIGVELAAKPKLLVFLDEPTSGLDSQTAWSICQLMKKLANHGQAILCTIHQPSAILMQEFDRLLFLQRGGKTVYFGDLGDGCKTMIDYFESHGSHKCPPDANPAEWMLEVVGAAPGSHANQDYHEVWRNSDEYQKVQEELEWMSNELPKKNTNNSETVHKEFATGVLYQCKLVSLRLFQQYWRSPDYLWSKFFLTIFNNIFIGFTFFKADRSLQGLQNQMLAVFMFTVIFNPLLQQYLPSFVQQRDLYEARERPSRTFSWKAFIVSQILVEIPWNILAGTVAFVIYYYAIGFYSNASVAHQLHERGALFWLFSCAFYVYIGSLALFCISFNQVAEAAANMASLMFTLSLSFCGVLVTPNGMPRFWIFMYRVSPLTYLIDGMLSTGVANVAIKCSNYELLRFSPAANLTCGEYLGPYLQTVKTGYIVDPSATDTCELCPYSHTNDFLSSVSSKYSRRWRNWGIFICYIAFNYIAGIFLYWLARVPKKSGKLAKK